jgi:hypothetical protein
MGALSYSGSPDAQDELMSMYRDGNLDMVGQTSVIDAFTMMDGALTDEGLRFLQEAFASDDSDISGRAGLALGSAQRNKPTETLRQWIIERWRKAKNDGQRQTVLEYVGNSGDPALLTIIDEAMRVGDFDLQQLALFSTRFMEDDTVDSYLLKRFQNREFHERLRYEALSSLAMHTWQERFLPIMEDCVRDESMEAMRMRCARFTLEQLRHERRMKNLLASLRSSIRSESLQEFIDRELAD